jgi:hypothetical protein
MHSSFERRIISLCWFSSPFLILNSHTVLSSADKWYVFYFNVCLFLILNLYLMYHSVFILSDYLLLSCYYTYYQSRVMRVGQRMG